MPLVFSTNRDLKLEPEADERQTLPAEQQNLHVRMERKGRGGKTATVVEGFVGRDEDLESLARTLKSKCGVGGSAKDGLIIIQGDIVPKIKQLLTSLGYRVK